MSDKKAIICYVPVLHEGYRKFFEKYKDADLYILGQDLIEKSDYLYKEIRALDSELARKAIRSWHIFVNVFILDSENIKELESAEIIAPREDVIEKMLAEYFPEKKIIYDDIFLRWDRNNTVKKNQVNPDMKISVDELDKKLMLEAHKTSEKSSDWWRRVGAVIVKDGKIIISAYNKHVPSEHMPYVNGDPRSCSHKGEKLELFTSIHAEAFAIAQTAQKGISLEGASMYTNNFPCPPCAKLIAYSGIKKLYYTIGYAVLDGESILKENGVEIIFVDVDLPEKKSGLASYPKK